jgi:plasmid stabilization system protein ParE
MTRRYKVDMLVSARKDIFDLGTILVRHAGHEHADQWEENLFKSFDQLTTNPLFQVQSRESRLMGQPVRRYVYRTTKNSKTGYHVYYTLEENEIPDPEPTEDYFAGIVIILFVRSASARAISAQELIDRKKEALKNKGGAS